MASPGRTDPAVPARVTAVRPVGGYDAVSLSVSSSPAWERSRPGQLVAVPGEPGRGELLPRVHWLAHSDVDPLHGTTVEVVVPAGQGPGPGEEVRLLGPLGRGFPLPSDPVPVLVVAQGISAAPVHWLVTLLRSRGCAVHVLLAADDPDAHLDPGSLRRRAETVVLTTPADLPAALADRLDDPATDPAVVFATGPRPLVGVVAALAAPRGRVVRVAAVDPEDPVVCGTGLCGGCDLVLEDADGPRRVRPCLEGPVVPGEWLLTARSEVRRAPR